jgi:hypothetical protein
MHESLLLHVLPGDSGYPSAELRFVRSARDDQAMKSDARSAKMIV